MTTNWHTSYYRYKRYFTSLSRFYQGRKTQTYAGIIFSLLAIIFFLVFAIKPTLITIAGLTKQIEDQRLVTQKMQEKINHLNQAQQEYQAIKGDLYLIDEALPKDSQVSTLIKQIEALAYRSGATLQTVKVGKTSLIDKSSPPPKTPKDTKAEQSTNLTLSLSGRYPNLKEFLGSLTSLRRIISAQSFGFKSDKGESENLTLTLEAKTYYLAQ